MRPRTSLARALVAYSTDEFIVMGQNHGMDQDVNAGALNSMSQVIFALTRARPDYPIRVFLQRSRKERPQVRLLVKKIAYTFEDPLSVDSVRKRSPLVEEIVNAPAKPES